MSYMFENSKFSLDLSNWDVSNVKDMSHMFESSNFNSNISSWDVRCRKTKCMFHDCRIREEFKPKKLRKK